jgi:hypothetical protein
MPAYDQLPHKLLFTILAYAYPAGIVAGSICLVKLEAGNWIVSKLRALFRAKRRSGKPTAQTLSIDDGGPPQTATERG